MKKRRKKKTPPPPHASTAIENLYLYKKYVGVDSIPILKWPVPLQQIIFVVVFYILILISASGTEPGTL